MALQIFGGGKSGGGTSAASGLLSARPAATGSKAQYTATDVAGGTTYLDTASGVWTQIAGPVVPAGLGGPSYNFTPQNFKNLRKTFMKVRDVSGPCKVLCVGDSTTRGDGTTGTNPHYTKPWPRRLSDLLNSYYIPASTGLLVVGGNAPTDTRLTTGAGWANAGGGTAGFGGASLSGTSGGAGSVTFTPGFMCDTFDIYHFDNAGGTSIASLDTGETASVVATGSTGVKKTTLTGVRTNSHVLSIACPTGGGMFLMGIDAYDSTTPTVRVALSGVGSTQGSHWADNGQTYRSLSAIGKYAPDLTIVMLGINDASALVSVAAYSANIQAIITKAKLSGDVILCSVVPSSASGLTGAAASVAREVEFANECARLATVNGCGFVDINTRWVDYATSSAAGYYTDFVHPLNFGHLDVAQALFNAITTV